MYNTPSWAMIYLLDSITFEDISLVKLYLLCSLCEIHYFIEVYWRQVLFRALLIDIIVDMTMYIHCLHLLIHYFVVVSNFSSI